MSITLLLISILALGAGPLLVGLSSSHGAVRKALDGFVTIGVGGLVLFHILPPSIATGGYTALVFVAAGMIMPTAIERVQHGNIQTAHIAALILAFLALSLHALSDGVVISMASKDATWAFSTAFAVVLHRIPVGIAVWVFLRASKGLKWVVVVFALITLGTVAGYVSGDAVIRLLRATSFAWFQAFVAGSLLHVIFHAHEHDHHFDHGDPFGHGHAHVHAHPSESVSNFTGELQCVVETWDRPDISRARRLWALLDLRAVYRQLPELVGAALGIGLIVLVSWVEAWGRGVQDVHVHGHGAHTSHLVSQVGVAGAASPLADIGATAAVRFVHIALDCAPWLLAGYILSVFLFRFLDEPAIPWLNGGGRWRSAARGSVYGVAMPVRACGVVPVFGSLVDRGARWSGAVAFLVSTPQLRLETLLFSIPLLGVPLTGVRVAAIVVISIVVGGLSSHLVGVASHPVDVRRPPRPTLASSVRQALLRLVDDTAPWVVFGVLVAALVPPDGFHWLASLPAGWSIVIFGLLGVPIYVCATGLTPVAAALILVGVSPGAAIVFLLSGPMTLWNSFRTIRVRWGMGASFAAVGLSWLLVLGAGWFTTVWIPEAHFVLNGDYARYDGDIWRWCVLGALVVLYAWSLLRQGPRAWLSTVVAGDHG